MGMIDDATKDYVRKNEVFADAVNFAVYNGERVVKAENLSEIDTAIGTIISQNANIDRKQRRARKRKAIQAYRDIIKRAVIKSDGNTTYVILGVENQSNIDYTMPVRSMLYDALQYNRQVSDIAAENRQKAERGKSVKGSGEFLSGFYKENHLIPVITVVVYFGADKWDGPLSLYDMFDVQDERTMEHVQNYRINLIEPNSLTEEELSKFTTGFRHVMSCIKYSEDKKKLEKYISSDKNVRLDEEAAKVIETVTGISMEIEEDTDMRKVCKAVQDMMDDSREEGRIIILTKLVDDGIISVDYAANMAGMEKTEFINKSKSIKENNINA